jgi:hypothetical protein
MHNYQFFDLAAESYRERERILLREVEIDRLLRAGAPRPAGNRIAMRLGESLVQLGFWLQRRAAIREGAA